MMVTLTCDMPYICYIITEILIQLYKRKSKNRREEMMIFFTACRIQGSVTRDLARPYSARGLKMEKKSCPKKEK